MEAYQLCVSTDQLASVIAPCHDEGSYSEYELCIYGEPQAPCQMFTCCRCQSPVFLSVTQHLVYPTGHRLCDHCMSTALYVHTGFSLNATHSLGWDETPPSSSSDFGDSRAASKYGDDPGTCLREIELDHPETTPTTTHPELPSREAAPPLVDGYRQRYVAPMPAKVTINERRLLEDLTSIFNADDPLPWPAEKLTWLKVSHSRRLSQGLLPLPSQIAILAEHLMFVYPAGILVFYTDVQAVHHYRTGNETIPTTVNSAISLARKKLGLCCLIFARRRVGILEILTHPEQTQQSADVRSAVEEAAASLRRRHRRWRKF